MDKEQRQSLQMVLQKMQSEGRVAPTKDARQAQRILQSLRDYQPVITGGRDSPTRGIQVKNPVVGYTTNIFDDGKSNTISFYRNDGGGMQRPKSSTKPQEYGTQAVVQQAVNEIFPARRDDRYSTDRRPSYYDFYAVQDRGDEERAIKKGRRVTAKDNQRAKKYRRMSNGAMNAIPDRDGIMVGRGERITETKFQPRGEGGRVQKYVDWDLTRPVKILGTIAKRLAPFTSPSMAVANKLQPLLFAGDLIKQSEEKLGPVADATLKTNASKGKEPRSQTAYKPVQGPPKPQPKPRGTQQFKAPPPQNQAVLAMKGGQQGVMVNGIFIPKEWSFNELMRYEANK